MVDDRLGFNERKKQILEFLRGNSSTAQEVSDEMGITEGAARHLLARYNLSGLIKKSKSPMLNQGRGPNPYYYTLSETGRILLDENKIKVRLRK